MRNQGHFALMYIFAMIGLGYSLLMCGGAIATGMWATALACQGRLALEARRGGAQQRAKASKPKQMQTNVDKVETQAMPEVKRKRTRAKAI